VIPEVPPACASGPCLSAQWSFGDALAFGPGGQILIGGWQSPRRPGFDGSVLAAIDPAGVLDQAFGNAGRAQPTANVGIISLDPVADGGLVAVELTEADRLGLERYNPAGAPLDPDSSIQWLTRGSEREATATIDRSGRIYTLIESPDGEVQAARYLPSGQPDPTFGDHGSVVLAPLRGSASLTLATTVDGGLLIGAINTNITIERLRRNGAADLRFGRHAVAHFPSPQTLASGIAKPLALAASATRIFLATGETTERSGVGRLVVFDLTAWGHPTRTFAHSGVLRTTLPGHASLVEPKAIAFEPSGNAIVVGHQRHPIGDTPSGEWFLARYTSHGSDCSFGSHGSVLSGVGGGAESVSVQPDGHILITGWRSEPAGPAAMVARYDGGGSSRTCGSLTSN
jgi:uncharacterized delta-60 repeat protein